MTDVKEASKQPLSVVSITNPALDDRRLAEICRRYDVGRLDIFGSVSRGDAGPSSDVDVLYELAPGARLGWEIEDLADKLTQVLGRRVDLVSRGALHDLVAGLPLDEMNADRQRRDALLWNFTVLGEAAAQLDQETRDRPHRRDRDWAPEELATAARLYAAGHSLAATGVYLAMMTACTIIEWVGC